MIHERKVLGIIGGMGPMATADLFVKIIESTDADCDGGHLHILIDNNTDIPDRTQSILSGSDAPLRFMAESAERLTAQGADILVIPCHTAHYYYDGLQKLCRVPILNMLGVLALSARSAGYRRLGLLATDGVVQSGIYDRAFADTGIELIYPDPEGQEKLMQLIYEQVKAGKPADVSALEPCLDGMVSRGAQAFILGCTELPLVFSDRPGRHFIDPTAILAKAAIKAAGGSIKPEP